MLARRLPRPRLRLILAIANLLILLLPLAGVAFLRLYDNALIRQTEAELIAQAAFVSAHFRREVAAGLEGARLATEYGRALAPTATDRVERWRHRPAELDLARAAIYPVPPDATPAEHADPVAAVAGDRLTPLLREAQRVTLAAIRVTDHRGVVVASTGADAGRSLTESFEVAGALAGTGRSILRERVPEPDQPPLSSISRGAGIRVFVTAPVVHENRVVGAVLLSRTPRSIEEALHARRYELGLLGLALVGAVLLVALFTSFAISRPVDALIRQARRAVRGERGAVTPLARPVTQELAGFSSAVARMAGALEQRAEYIRTFAAHVSHEFKSPLTAIQGAAELLQDHGETMTDAERERFVGNILADAERLSALVGHLLDLARADTAAADGKDVCQVDAVVRRVLARPWQGPVSVAPSPGAEQRVAMHADTLASILTSLVDNALQHGAREVRIATGGARGRHGPEVTIRIADDGPGISPKNASRIFEPFFTTARERGGTGLGLAIVAALLRAHRGTVSLVEGRQGATFEVRLPAAGAPGREGS